MTMTPPILTSAADLLAGYDVLFCDVWGVLHNGRTAYAAAGAVLAEFRTRGGTVVLVSNAPQPAARVAAVMADKGVRRDCWDAIVSSGDIAIAHVARQGYGQIHGIGPMPRSHPFFSALPARNVPLEEAEAVVCTGLADDVNESAEHYRPLLGRALARALPFVCANPDLMVDVGGRLYVCAGAIAALYESMGGSVTWAGKPHASAYAMAQETAERLRGAAVPRARVLAIGDAVRTDLAAAVNAGVDSLFVTGGIHRHECMADEAIVPEKLAAVLAGTSRLPVAVMAGLG